jgi:hypothetical protein
VFTPVHLTSSVKMNEAYSCNFPLILLSLYSVKLQFANAVEMVSLFNLYSTCCIVAVAALSSFCLHTVYNVLSNK